MEQITLRATFFALLAGIATLSSAAAHCTEAAQARVDPVVAKSRVVVLTDMGNEPDDQMSLVRLLVYSNALDLEGLIATTSTWQKNVVRPDTIAELVDAYGAVRPQLLEHATGWPAAAALKAMIRTGPSGYGLAVIKPDQPSEGARLIIAATDRTDARPLWINVWGGANTLAEALARVRSTRTAVELATFIAKLRVYSISDQDDAGPWIRREFPDLFYIVQPSTQDGDEYARATWTGISGDLFYRNGEGADITTVTNDWLDANIRAKGPLGRHYPQFLIIMEGDTPAFLHLIPNGLESYRNPSWGGWGGRYVHRQPYGETRAIWTQGGNWFGRVTSADTVRGVDGKMYTSDQATIWRWREAFQNDFAARTSWSVEPFGKANHNPVVIVNGRADTSSLEISVREGEQIVLDAAGTRDPDDDVLRYHWFHYSEAGGPPAPGGSPASHGLADIALATANDQKAIVTAIKPCRAMWLPNRACPPVGVAHVILAVTDDGSPALTSYRRVILTVQGKPAQTNKDNSP
jgi:hypothetical protein